MIKRDDFIKMLDEIAEVVKRDPSQLLNPKSDFRNKLHEFRTWQNEYTKRKMCSFCQKKLKLKDLSHHQKVTFTLRDYARSVTRQTKTNQYSI